MGIELRVQSSFCGTNLRTGTIIIGTVDFFGALATGIVASRAAIASDFLYYSEDYLDCWKDPMSELKVMYIIVAVFNYILMLFDCLLLFGVTSTQARPKLILLWIFYAFASLLLNFICFIIYGIYSFKNYYDTNGYLSISWTIFYLDYPYSTWSVQHEWCRPRPQLQFKRTKRVLPGPSTVRFAAKKVVEDYTALKIYFLLVVWSHYHQLLGGAGTTLKNGVQGTTYPTVPTGQQLFPNAPQTYPNVQMQYQNQPQPYPNAQQPYPNVQVQQTFPNPQQPYPNPQQPYPNPQQLNPNPPQPYPNPQQSYPNPQQPYPNPQQSYPNSQQPYPNPQQLPSMESMRRDI